MDEAKYPDVGHARNCASSRNYPYDFSGMACSKVINVCAGPRLGCRWARVENVFVGIKTNIWAHHIVDLGKQVALCKALVLNQKGRSQRSDGVFEVGVVSPLFCLCPLWGTKAECADWFPNETGGRVWSEHHLNRVFLSKIGEVMRGKLKPLDSLGLAQRHRDSGVDCVVRVATASSAQQTLTAPVERTGREKTWGCWGSS